MFENLKKKLKGIFGKVSEQIEEKPAEPQTAEGAVEELQKEVASLEREVAELPPAEVKMPPEAQGEKKEVAVLPEEKLPTSEERIEEIIEGPKLPPPEEIEIITVEEKKEEKRPPPAPKKEIVPEIFKEPIPPKPDEIEIVTVEAESESDRKIAAIIEGPKLPPPEEIEIITVEEEKKQPLPPKKEEPSLADRLISKIIKKPKLPPPEDIEIITVEPEKPAAEIDVLKVHEKPKEVLRELKTELEEVEEKPGIFKLFSKITHKELGEKDLSPILWELEIALLENDVAKEVAEKLCAEVKQSLLSKKARRGTVEEIIKSTLKQAVSSILSAPVPDLFKLISSESEKPFVIVFFGFNGTGKTLTIGKFAKLLQDNGFSVVMAAGDTFRAAAIEQLEVHAKNLKVPLIKQKKGADSAAVIFDAVEHARSKGIDVVLADTAGRSHTNINLMDELKKIVRVNKPNFKVFVGDSLTGNDAAEQAKLFNDAVGIDASVLTKVDTDPKGGACLSVAYVTEKPILYLGTGQKYGDIMPFSAKWFVDKVF